MADDGDNVRLFFLVTVKYELYWKLMMKKMITGSCDDSEGTS